MTVTLHVDDLKVSHKSKLEITMFILYLGKFYGSKITINQGDVHDYFGMDLVYSEKSKVIMKVSSIKYVEKILQDFPEEIKSLPAADISFKSEELEAKTLLEEQAEQFHHSVHNCCFCQPEQEQIFSQQWHFSQQG